MYFLSLVSLSPSFSLSFSLISFPSLIPPPLSLSLLLRYFLPPFPPSPPPSLDLSVCLQ